MGFTINSSTSRWITKWRTAAPPRKPQIAADEPHADDDRKSIIHQETFERYWAFFVSWCWRCNPPPHCLHQLLDMGGWGCKRLQHINFLKKKNAMVKITVQWTGSSGVFLLKEMSGIRKDPIKNPQLNLNLLTVLVSLFMCTLVDWTETSYDTMTWIYVQLNLDKSEYSQIRSADWFILGRFLLPTVDTHQPKRPATAPKP